MHAPTGMCLCILGSWLATKKELFYLWHNACQNSTWYLRNYISCNLFLLMNVGSLWLPGSESYSYTASRDHHLCAVKKPLLNAEILGFCCFLEPIEKWLEKFWEVFWSHNFTLWDLTWIEPPPPAPPKKQLERKENKQIADLTSRELAVLEWVW